MPYYFYSRERRYRDPFGAVPEGTSVFLRICLPRNLECREALLTVESDGAFPRKNGMFWAGMEGDDYEWWDCHFTPEVPGIYWYGFELSLRDGTGYLVKTQDATADLVRTPGGRVWQLTCYAKDFKTPDWLSGGIMYQIFPDRFATSGSHKENVPADRVLHENWEEQPQWRKDETGTIRNKDYFGGDLKGIEQRLDHLVQLGVTCLYLNPIFEAHSNHRYDTADYRAIDPLLGTIEDFRSLTKAAAQLGIHVILDGVFSHTGADSRYFNREQRYPQEGAYNSLSSPYTAWYHFDKWPKEYQGWWGFATLPEVDELAPAYLSYMTGEDGVAVHWLEEGASGWRLDVADELPDAFLEALRRAMKTKDPNALLLGEVWEDASNKQSYGHRRRYLIGQQLDSVMNYPFRDAVLHFLQGGGASAFLNAVLKIVENYPPQVTRLLMNHIGTHDTERAITALAGEPARDRGREWQAVTALTPVQRQLGIQLMQLASALQYCLPGVPCVYYGDEAGMEGYRDPFNRGTYPWGHEEETLLRWYHKLGQIRKVCPALKEGDFLPVLSTEDVVCFQRQNENSALLCAVNRFQGERTVQLPARWYGYTVNLGGGWIEGETLHLPALTCALLLA